jgi:N-acetylmuramic acid 6-phosphate etherase
MKTTEQDSNYNNLEFLSTSELLKNINDEDKKVAFAVEKQLFAIEKLVDNIVENMKEGGRLFYLGAGTSGRLGILDASECPPTFGVPHDLVIGIIAGGDTAIRKAVEFAEDDTNQGFKDLEKFNINDKDTVVGLSASGSTPYVLGTLKKCNEKNITTACIVCNSNSDIEKISKYPITVVAGPEFVTGSTRMKSGTAQKLVLNMISTSVMIKIGKVKGNKMVDMQLSNNKLVDRGARIIANELNIDLEKAKNLLLEFGSVRKAINSVNKL